MGMGDLKLAIPLGLIFGWPGAALVLIAAFVIGADSDELALFRKMKRLAIYRPRLDRDLKLILERQLQDSGLGR